MKNLITIFFAGSSLFLISPSIKAEWDYWARKHSYTEGLLLYTYDSSNPNESTFRTAKCFTGFNFPCGYGDSHYVDSSTGEYWAKDGNPGAGNIWFSYNPDTDIWTNRGTGSCDTSTYYACTQRVKRSPEASENSNGDKSIEITGTKVLEIKSDGSVQIGADGNDIDITAEGLNVDGNPLITKKDNGEIHIGKNSLITKSEEETLSDGRKVQPLFAKDADGNKIPINIDGSKLLIDGVEVFAGGDSAQVTTNKNNISTNKANIKNLGEGVAGSTALTAALTALPQTSKESKLSCGVGSGAYSSRYAVGFGCASKVNERVDINAGGSYVFGGSKSYGEGTLDSGVVKAGFVFKLGELNKPTQISMKDKKKMESKIESLEERNKQLLSRLERLEKIALIGTKSKDLAVYKLK